jgi:hypothetical protein
MPPEKLPAFKSHPDPLATGSVAKSRNKCVACGRVRGFIYTGPAYSEETYDEAICPWCIADGSAHKKFGVTFHDEASVPGHDFDAAPEVSAEIVAEVCHRTPGFTGWQQEQWFTCCDDAAAFLGRAGREELESEWPDAIDAVRRASAIEDDDEWEEFLDTLDRDGSPTAYVFKCLHCGKYGAYHDSD